MLLSLISVSCTLFSLWHLTAKGSLVQFRQVCKLSPLSSIPGTPPIPVLQMGIGTTQLIWSHTDQSIYIAQIEESLGSVQHLDA